MYLGEIRAFAAAVTLPPGWHPCDGQDGRPDYRGRVLVCAGSGPGLTSRTAGDSGGSEVCRVPVSTADPNVASPDGAVPSLAEVYNNATPNATAGTGSGSDWEQGNMPPFAVIQYAIYTGAC